MTPAGQVAPSPESSSSSGSPDSSRFSGSPDCRSSSEEQGGVEQELPSSSLFYTFFDPVVENERPLFTLPIEVWNTGTPNSNIYSIENLMHEPTLKNFCPVSTANKTNKRRSLSTRKKCRKLNLDVELLAEEYAQLAKITADNDNRRKETEIRLNMQDKELEEIIADIAKLCEMNVTLTRDLRKAKKHKNDLKEKAQECRVENLSYETGAMMLAAENKELKVDIENLQNEIDKAKETNKNRELKLDESLDGQPANLRRQIKEVETEKDEKVRSINFNKEYGQRNLASRFDDGLPCTGRLNKISDYHKNDELAAENSHIVDEMKSENIFCIYNKLPQISLPSNPKEQNNPLRLNIMETSVPTATPGPGIFSQNMNIGTLMCTSGCVASSSKVTNNAHMDDNLHEISFDALNNTGSTYTGPISASGSPN